MTDLGSSPRFLISRLSAVGDCILTTPLLCALREYYPDAFIAWVTEPGPATLLTGHPCLDELVIAPKGWIKSWSATGKLRQHLRQLEIDVAFDPQSLTRSAVAARLSGARRRIGFARPLGRELAPWLNRERVVKTAAHVVDGYLELLGPLNISSSTVRFDLPDYPDARHSMADVIDSPRHADGYAVLNPGAGWDSKVWPAERLAHVARFLGRQMQLPSVAVWSGDRERGWAEQIVEQSDGHATLGPATSLPELAELNRGARLFVGSDTGPLHLAVAVETSCVAIYGPTLPSVCGPYGERHISLQAYHQTEGNRKKAGNHAMRAVSAEQVCEACRTVLLRDAAQPGAAGSRLDATSRRTA